MKGMGICLNGIVLATSNNLSKVLCADGNIRMCSIKGKRIKTLTASYNSLAVGDEVCVSIQDGERGQIELLQNRRTVFGRYNEKGRAEQVIAANIDMVCCVTSPTLPPFRPRFIDRVAVLAEFAEVPFHIICNKSDLGLPPAVADRLDGYKKLGYEVHVVSAETHEGIESLKRALAGRLSVFAGQSGVGKSSLLNALMPGLERKIQSISVKYERGRHTTTMAEMIFSDEMRIIDTPGIRRLALRSLPLDSLAACFPEIRTISPACALGARCSHGDEDGCAVRQAAESGSIHPDRYESYLRIRSELLVRETWKKEGVRDPGRKDRAVNPGGTRKKNRFLKNFSAEQDDELE